jgi:hypothetical protein
MEEYCKKLIIELGSDFHYCANFSSGKENILSKKETHYFANGRQALQHLLKHNKWERIWIPTYFCYSVIEVIKQTGIKIAFYDDSPLSDDERLISQIKFNSNDALLRMNYFGLRTWRDNEEIPVSVIEDHSHDLCGEWVEKSNANWIIASVRKTLSVPEGGVLWSPKGHTIPTVPKSTLKNDLLTYKRLSAMLMKTLYLSQNKIPKDAFRQLYIDTEDSFENLSICAVEDFCKKLIETFDIKDWYQRKKENWKSLLDIECKNIKMLRPEDISKCNPFALILQFNSMEQRDIFKTNLIQKQIYPAVLWNIPQEQPKEIVNIGQTLLSVHCDARYDSQDILELKKRILSI